jgi:3D (Asp-Asp-Asp) domain-containing protein
MKRFLTAMFVACALFSTTAFAEETNALYEIDITIVTGEDYTVKSIPLGYTVEDLIARLTYETGDLFLYQEYSDRVLQADDEVILTHLRAEQVYIQGTVNYDIIVIFNEELPYGEEITHIYGEEGVQLSNVLVFFENGIEIGRQVLSTQIIQEPISAFIEVGDLRVVTTVNGDVLRFSRRLTMEATAYTPEQTNLSDRTAIGMAVERGIVAIDPRVIPLRTWLYIPGYGLAFTADTGGVILGYKIDLVLCTMREAINFGRQNITVYVLEDFDPSLSPWQPRLMPR